MPEITKPFADSKIFRDVDVAQLNYEKARLYIIDRVLNYGRRDDFLALI